VPSRAAKAEGVEERPGAGKESKRVIVADDDPAVCALLKVVLEPLAAVTAVPDAEAALEIIASEEPFDVIISDFMLPGIDGVEFVKRVRSDERQKRVPILVISGHGPIGVGERARAAGADAFLDKPFSLGELRGAVALLLGARIQLAS